MADDSHKFITGLLDLQLPFAINLARNGKSLVYSTSSAGEFKVKSGENSTCAVWHAEIGKADSARQITSGLYNDEQPALSPDGTTIAFISDRAKQGTSSAIYAVSLSGGEPYPLTSTTHEQGITKLQWSPDGKSIAYLSADEKSEEKHEKEKIKDDAIVYGEDWQYHCLRLLDVSSREVTTLVSIHEHIRGFDYNHSGSSIAFYTQPTPDVDSASLCGNNIYTISSTGERLEHVLTFPSGLHALVHTDTALYFVGFVTVDSPHSSTAVYSVQLGDEKPACKLVAHGKTDDSRDLRRIDNDVTTYVECGIESRISMVNGRMLVMLKDNISSYDAAYTTDSDEIIIAMVRDDINTPGEVYSTTASGGALVKLSSHGSSYKSLDSAATVVSCGTLDNTDTIEGVLFTPAEHKNEHGNPSKPLATIVSVHGGPFLRVTNSFNPSYFYFTNSFLQAGYAVLHPNYRGSSGRGESFADKARGGVGVYDEPDVIALTQHCIENGYIDKDQCIIQGWSQGGFMSYLCAVHNGMHKFGWKFRGAIPGAGVTDWNTMSFSSDIGFIQAAFAGDAVWTSDQTDTSSRKGSAIWQFKKAVEAKAIPPILMLHGEKDARVPIEQSKAFRRALQHYKLPFEHVVYPREGHLFCERKHIEDMLMRSLRFVDRCLKS